MKREPLPHDAAAVARRLRAAFGPLYATLVEEAPERAAWTRLGMAEVETAMQQARDRAGEPGHALGFRTLLKQELDALCELAPPVMSFEASTVAADRQVRQQARRLDERARDQERRAQTRRDELWAQAARLASERSRDE
ncbi:MAG: hypothetical protein WD336_05375 [Trueperaceae bacterium]